MSVDENVFRSLVDMGIDSVLARAAAARFTHSEAAVNWCFGDGATVRRFDNVSIHLAHLQWSPEQDRVVPVPTVARPVPPTPDFAKAGTTGRCLGHECSELTPQWSTTK
jgi:hypothetical protein